jgi:NTP pyrophosphatase (non-canonical NTP hydrolase)
MDVEERSKRAVSMLPVHSYVSIWGGLIGQTYPSRPVSKDEMDTTIDSMLIAEETKELLDAIEQKDYHAICDGIGDSLWVITQLGMKMGFNINDINRAVFQSNMSKICRSEEEAKDTVIAYRDGLHPDKLGQFIDTYYEQTGEDAWVVKRYSDNKVLKSINFRNPDFNFMLRRKNV